MDFLLEVAHDTQESTVSTLTFNDDVGLGSVEEQAAVHDDNGIIATLHRITEDTVVAPEDAAEPLPPIEDSTFEQRPLKKKRVASYTLEEKKILLKEAYPRGRPRDSNGKLINPRDCEVAKVARLHGVNPVSSFRVT